MATTNVLPPRILILVVSYEAERFIESVLGRIPRELLCGDSYDTEILVIDDSSFDNTFDVALQYAEANPAARIEVLSNPVNLGYGGNQKLGYHYAIENGFDIVVLLHGDGQYAPEMLPDMIEPIIDNSADVVLGSRMVRRVSALRGGMPLYKWLGNQILTRLQNAILRTHLSEYHTGYRAYRASALSEIPFDRNSDYFDFDTDVLIQLLDANARFSEISIPTYYGEEISRVNGLRYAFLVLWTSLTSRIMKHGLLYHRKFDYEQSNTHYGLKLGYSSSHEFALEWVEGGSKVVDIGCGPGLMAERLAKRGCDVVSIDRWLSPEAREFSAQAIEADLDTLDFGPYCADADFILLLDVIEHLKSPETFLERLRVASAGTACTVVLTTGNVAFLPIRLSLLLGTFNYGRRGILDLSHTRLFTFGSMRRLLRQSGYQVAHTRGIPAPFPLALGDNALARWLVRLNAAFIRVSKSLFAYQVACVASPTPTLSALLGHAEQASKARARNDEAGPSGRDNADQPRGNPA